MNALNRKRRWCNSQSVCKLMSSYHNSPRGVCFSVCSIFSSVMWFVTLLHSVSGEMWSTSIKKRWVEAEGPKSVCVFTETHLPGTRRRRWSGDNEPGTAEAPPSAPEPRSNPQQFHHRRSSWRKSGSTWGNKTEGISLSIHILFLFFFPQCVWVVFGNK